MKSFAAVIILALSFIGAAFAQDEGVDLTVYNQNFALVKDRRFMEIPKGVNEVRFTDVASQIEPTSVHFKSLTDPKGCVIQEQNYEYDLVGATKLLFKYIDKKIKILAAGGTVYEGVLMSYDGDSIVLSQGATKSLSMVVFKDNIKNIDFPELPEGLVTKPTLMWRVSNDKQGRHLTEVTYLTNGVTWLCDYVAVVNDIDTKIDLSGWVTIDNKSGSAYKNAGLKLMAGDVHRVQESYRRENMAMAKAAQGGADQFQEKSFFEYHMYTLQRKTTVKNNQTKQVTLFSASDIPVKKLFLFDPALYGWWIYYNDVDSSKAQKIKVKLEIENIQKNNLGMPLPKGKIKVYKRDTDGSLEFIGEDSIDHTPKDEKFRIYLGDAFDIVGERKKVDFKKYGNSADETVEISLRNHKSEDIEVAVVEHMWRYNNWDITAKTHEYTKKDAGTIEFKVPVPKNGETKINYTVHYSW